jgi:hypothetical protein
MSHLSLVLAKSNGLTGASMAIADHNLGLGNTKTILNSQASIRDSEASRFEDCTLPAGIASMEHWLDLNA